MKNLVVLMFIFVLLLSCISTQINKEFNCNVSRFKKKLLPEIIELQEYLDLYDLNYGDQI